MTIGGSDFQTELAAIKPWADRAAPIAPAERQARLEKARTLTESLGADALLVHVGTAMRYFTGLTWEPSERLIALLLPVSGEPLIICPAFEEGSLSAELQVKAKLLLWEEHEAPVTLLAGALAKLGVRRLAVDPLLSFANGEKLRAALPGLQLLDGAPAIDGCRMIKSPAELALMQQAKSMTLEVHRRAARMLQPGITTTEVKRFINEAHRAIGSAGSTFCIVQFGHATAYPHGLPGEQALEEGQLVLIDTGCRVEGYHSDITRTYGFGKVSAEEEAIWTLEKEAQQAAFEAVKPGVACEDVDAAARRVLEKAGLGPDYRLPGLPHRTGHGIGLAIHEPAYLVRGDKTPLAPGMCFSNEPMIVVPARFGVRLEDHFHVTETGASWFTGPQPAIDTPV
ncbi:M24 family metallopeptidase [Gimibacter soli]|uniref:Xaa-Pro peptidase family protein n=1 Tax=Gimibacter soli TaxID=3024400 RepID=A0AAE9XP10_9PROT|nr:Xaa-Pro peptidase family protein [Gimibacter soli]WCL53572.1 Xaa-Pro peptidase family protein [Gimibacter soli]